MNIIKNVNFKVSVFISVYFVAYSHILGSMLFHFPHLNWIRVTETSIVEGYLRLSTNPQQHLQAPPKEHLGAPRLDG